MATLLAIDGDNVLWSKMNSFVNGCVDKFEHIKDVASVGMEKIKNDLKNTLLTDVTNNI
jgi:hypothetical protein